MASSLKKTGKKHRGKDLYSEGKVTEAKLPKRFTVKTKQRIGDVLYNPGTYALKKKDGEVVSILTWIINQMLGGLDAENNS